MELWREYFSLSLAKYPWVSQPVSTWACEWGLGNIEVDIFEVDIFDDQLKERPQSKLSIGSPSFAWRAQYNSALVAGGQIGKKIYIFLTISFESWWPNLELTISDNYYLSNLSKKQKKIDMASLAIEYWIFNECSPVLYNWFFFREVKLNR